MMRVLRCLLVAVLLGGIADFASGECPKLAGKGYELVRKRGVVVLLEGVLVDDFAREVAYDLTAGDVGNASCFLRCVLSRHPLAGLENTDTLRTLN